MATPEVPTQDPKSYDQTPNIEIRAKIEALDKLIMGAGEYHDDPYEYVVPLRHIKEYRADLAKFNLSEPIFRDKSAPATKPLDEQLDEILVDSVGMDFCENDECSHYGQYLEAKTAIKALITNAEKQAYSNVGNYAVDKGDSDLMDFIDDRIKELEQS